MAWLLPCVSAFGEPALVSTARQLHSLPAEEADEGLPVHLVATVTFYEPEARILMVQDATGAVFVRTTRPYPLQIGDRIVLDGKTAPSYRSVVAADPKIVVTAHGTLPKSRPTTFAGMMNGRDDCVYVSIQGKVRSAEIEEHDSVKVAQLEILVPGGIVQGFVQNYEGLDLVRLMDTEVEFSGVIGGVFNTRMQLMQASLYAHDATQVRVLADPSTRSAELPLTAVDDVMQTRFVQDLSQRVRVRGVVTYSRPAYALVIQQGDKSLFISTRQADLFALGTIVDVIGFADDRGYGPSLEEAEVFPTREHAVVVPAALNYGQALGGGWSDTLITMRGPVLSQLHSEGADTLVIMVDQHPVSVVLQLDSGAPALPTLAPGTLVSVVGICRNTRSGSWGKPLLFRIDMRQASDLVVIAKPSWWTGRHLIMALGGVTIVAVVVLTWVVVLRRKVAAQTQQLAWSMRVEKVRSRLLEKINSDSPLKDVLREICASIEVLIPGLRCECQLLDEAPSEKGAEETRRRQDHVRGQRRTVREAFLIDGKGRQIALFSSHTAEISLQLTAAQREVFHAGTSLATLAIKQRRMYQELNFHSTRDQLTGLPNRRFADLALDDALRNAEESKQPFGVGYIDLDHFKQVNDQYGHKIGDLYLQQIAARLGHAVRSGDVLARIGGDEFLLVAPELPGAEGLPALRERLESCFKCSFDLDGIRIQGSASIGLALFPRDGSNPADLKRHADAEMYALKQASRMNEPVRRMAETSTTIFSAHDLHEALKNGSFRLFYQPQFSAEGHLRAFEALLRLEDPVLGTVAPDAFIEVLERTDLAFEVGEWVLRRALQDALAWRLPALANLLMVVNVSARQIEQPDFAKRVSQILEELGFPARHLELEVTERMVLQDASEANQQLQFLHANGVRISIDDFGTGYSCLSRLHALTVDTLKIDRSFVRAMEQEPRVLRIIEAIVTMGHVLGKRVVAEGVETLDEIASLRALGEMDFQGFVLARPQAAEQIEKQIAGWLLASSGVEAALTGGTARRIK